MRSEDPGEDGAGYEVDDVEEPRVDCVGVGGREDGALEHVCYGEVAAYVDADGEKRPYTTIQRRCGK